MKYPTIDSVDVIVDVENMKIEQLSEEDKSEVQKLLARSSDKNFYPPSDMLNLSELCKEIVSFQEQKSLVPEVKKAPTDTTSLSSSVVGGAAQYINNFENPYVKITLACKFCSKDMDLNNKGKWKQHYLLNHAAESEKPFQCGQCEKGFLNRRDLNKHSESKHGVKAE